MPEEPPKALEPAPSELDGLDPGELLARGLNTVRTTHGGHKWTPPAPEELAATLPQYRIESLLGHGGMGAVYRGVQTALDRLVAIKLLPIEVSLDRDFAERFVREAKTLARLNHPNIVAVYDFGKTTGGHLYFVMEYVEGTDLHRMIHGPGLSAAQTLEITIGICEALQYAHGKGVVHRDIKPANVMVSTEGQVKVADFGLARLNAPDAQSPGTTVTGTVMGTPDYMAPEQTRGQHVDHRADIYSLGVMLYEMLCGQVPRGVFDPPSHKVRVDVRIDDVVLRAMQQEPERRYQNTREMKTDVNAIRTTPLEAPPGGTRSVVSQTSVGEGGGKTARPLRPTFARLIRDTTERVPPGVAFALLVLAALIGGAIFWRQNMRTKGSEVSKNAAHSDSVTLAVKGTPPLAPLPAPSAFRPLFDGQTFAGWRGYRATTAPEGWRVKDGAMIAESRSLLVSEEEFQDFELTLEWRVNVSGNGGIFFRMNEVAPNAPSGVAAEFQLMDDANSDPYKTGALHKAEHALKKAAKAVGEWNTARLLVQRGQCEHWVNEQLVCRYDLRDSATRERWRKLGIKSDFATATKGYIGLQAFTGEISYRNIRIRILPAEALIGTPRKATTISGSVPSTLAKNLASTESAGAAPSWVNVTDWLGQRVDGGSKIVENGYLHLKDQAAWSTARLPGGKLHNGALRFRWIRSHAKSNPQVCFRDGMWCRVMITATGLWVESRPSQTNVGNIATGALQPEGKEMELQIAAVGTHLMAWRDGKLIGELTLPSVGEAGHFRVQAADAILTEAAVLNLDGIPDADALAILRGQVARPSNIAPPSAISPTAAKFASATKDQPFVNLLGMKFVPVPITGGPTGGQRVLFSIWETRVQDYRSFRDETKREWPRAALPQAETHPAVNVSWDDANAFCDWLTERERKMGKLAAGEGYRLPTDHEWSCAVGIGGREDPAKTPADKSGQISGVYPWGDTWPPPSGAGNYFGEEQPPEFHNTARPPIAGYRDDFPQTAPVGSFTANGLGLYDLGGNAWEWCEDLRLPGSTIRAQRGGSWGYGLRDFFLSSFRFSSKEERGAALGVRVVVAEVAR